MELRTIRKKICNLLAGMQKCSLNQLKGWARREFVHELSSPDDYTHCVNYEL